ncbi:MAG: penicillin acylase family protein, partial [Saprospiraceae bacterium]
AQNAVKGWRKSGNYMPMIEAYVAGVNSYINSLEPKDYPVEFKLIGYEPEEWTVLKTAIFIKAMAESLCSRENDLESLKALNAFGRETFDFIYPEYFPKEDPIIPASVKWEFEPTPVEIPAAIVPAEQIGALPYEQNPKPPAFLGSNNWAVSGAKTASGNPILCNDPHLRLTLPAIWYEVQINTPDLNVYGVSLPGIPGVIIGFNENIAWGMTNVGQDLLDWYQIEWVDEKKDKYRLDGKAVPVRYVFEEYRVKGQATVIDTVKYTQWGPIVHENDQRLDQDLAMRWVAHDVPLADELSVFYYLNKSKNYDDYSEALASYNTPPQNIVFASKSGDIALRLMGKFPLKHQEQGRFVQLGNTTENAWHGFIPREQNPKVKNPARGFVASANQRSTDKSYPYYYNGGFEDFRGRILNQKLREMDSITVADMMALQNDNYGLDAEEMLPLLLAQLEPAQLDKSGKVAYQTLAAWDYKYQKDQAAPILFKLWYDAFYELTWDEVISRGSRKEMLYPEDWRTIALLRDHPTHALFDQKNTPEKEDAQAIVTASFQQMLLSVAAWKAEGKSLTWQSYKRFSINHLARLPAFSHQNLAVSGHKTTLNANNNGAGPSWRMIVELGSEIKAYGVYPGGQSGDPGSPYFDNMIERWVDGEYYPLHFLQRAEDLKEELLYTNYFNK